MIISVQIVIIIYFIKFIIYEAENAVGVFLDHSATLWLFWATASL